MDAWQQMFLQRVAADGNRVVFTGLGADNAFLGAAWCNDRGLVEAGTFPWVALAQRHGAVNGFSRENVKNATRARVADNRSHRAQIGALLLDVQNQGRWSDSNMSIPAARCPADEASTPDRPAGWLLQAKNGPRSEFSEHS